MKKGILVLVIGQLAISLTYAAVVNLNLVWNDLTFRGGEINQAQSVAFNRNRVIVGEVLGRAGGGPDVIVRGYDAMTGNVAWEDDA